MKTRAIVIDDSKVMRTMVIDTLKKSGVARFSFVEAEDGLNALNKFNPRNLDMAFVDVHMPNMDGIEFVRRVRRMGNSQDIKIVMITSEKTLGKMTEAIDEAGANEYIVKPFTIKQIRSKLKPIVRQMEKSKASNSPAFLQKLVS